MSTQQHPAVVATSSYWFVGSIASGGTRVQDLLMDPSTDSVRLSDVNVCRYAGTECVTTLSHVVVPKGKIELLILPSSHHEAPMRRLYKYTQKRTFRAVAVVGEYCVEGAVKLPIAPKDQVHTLAHQIDRFFPITQADVSRFGREPIHVPIALANKEFVSCFHVGDELEADSELDDSNSRHSSDVVALDAESMSLLEGLGILKSAMSAELQDS